MQLVSAVKMKKAQEVALQGRPYKTGLEEIVSRLLPTVDISLSNLLVTHTENNGRSLMILFTSHKGLCGAFNMNLFRVLLKEVDFKKTDFITVGKKGAVFVSLMGAPIIADFSEHVGAMDTAAIFELALKHYFEDKYESVYLVYNSFISTLRSEPKRELFLPFSLEYTAEGKASQQEENEYTIEPNPIELVDHLLQSFLEEKIRTAILNTEAAEHSSRMIAMKNATDNATEVMYDLTLTRNRLRQEKITYELLDMITAKESVEA